MLMGTVWFCCFLGVHTHESPPDGWVMGLKIELTYLLISASAGFDCRVPMASKPAKKLLVSSLAKEALDKESGGVGL